MCPAENVITHGNITFNLESIQKPCMKNQQEMLVTPVKLADLSPTF